MMEDIIQALISMTIVGVIYFIPSLVAHENNHKNTTPIVILNIFLGWTFIGWVIALIWACMEEK